MKLETTPTQARTSTEDYARLNEEVKRLLDFKKSNVRGRSRTPCPECATAIDVQANKCPQCGSEVAAHTARVREHLAELEETTAEIERLHRRYMEYREEESAMQPIVERVRRIVSDPQMADGFKTVLPAFLLFFAFLATLRILGNGPLFWAGSIAGGVVAYSILKKTSYKHYATVELYRAVLIVGLLILMSGAIRVPLSGWSIASGNRVEVVRPLANIRESASTDSRIVVTAKAGDKLTVLEKQAEWYRVKTADGQSGWLHSSLVAD